MNYEHIKEEVYNSIIIDPYLSAIKEYIIVNVYDSSNTVSTKHRINIEVKIFNYSSTYYSTTDYNDINDAIRNNVNKIKNTFNSFNIKDLMLLKQNGYLYAYSKYFKNLIRNFPMLSYFAQQNYYNKITFYIRILND